MENQKIGGALSSFMDQVKLGNDRELIVDQVMLSWEKIDKVMRVVIGKGGSDALFCRCVDITAEAFSWLTKAPLYSQSEMDLQILRGVFLQQDTTQVAAAGDAMLLHFRDLLSDLIGPSLTERLLRPVLGSLLTRTDNEDA